MLALLLLNTLYLVAGVKPKAIAVTIYQKHGLKGGLKNSLAATLTKGQRTSAKS